MMKKKSCSQRVPRFRPQGIIIIINNNSNNNDNNNDNNSNNNSSKSKSQSKSKEKKKKTNNTHTKKNNEGAPGDSEVAGAAVSWPGISWRSIRRGVFAWRV